VPACCPTGDDEEALQHCSIRWGRRLCCVACTMPDVDVWPVSCEWCSFVQQLGGCTWRSTLRSWLPVPLVAVCGAAAGVSSMDDVHCGVKWRVRAPASLLPYVMMAAPQPMTPPVACAWMLSPLRAFCRAITPRVVSPSLLELLSLPSAKSSLHKCLQSSGSQRVHICSMAELVDGAPVVELPPGVVSAPSACCRLLTRLTFMSCAVLVPCVDAAPGVAADCALDMCQRFSMSTAVCPFCRAIIHSFAPAGAAPAGATAESPERFKPAIRAALTPAVALCEV